MSKRGILRMSPEDRKRVQSLGGKAVSKDKEFMSRIGKIGGTKVSQDREYMRALGKKSAEKRWGKKNKDK